MSRLRSVWFALLLAVASPGQHASLPRRPNILVVIADDHSPVDLKLYNPASTLQTPVLERVAQAGMVIDGAYHMGSFSGAVCSPSRHMVMSGRTLWHLPIGPGAKERCPPDLPDQTLAAVFRRAGYATMRTCKAENCYPVASAQFAVRHDATMRGGVDEQDSAWHADRVLEFLAEREQRSTKAPFLVYLGFSHPHDPRNGKPELLAKYGAVNHRNREELPPDHERLPPLPSNYLRAHPFPHGHPNLRDEEAVSGVWDKRNPRTIRNELGRQFACLEDIDTQLGRVLAQLERAGELAHTYVIYTSDHGIALGRHGLVGKQNLYEHSWRVPLLVQGPGIAKGTRRVGNVYLLDLLSTLCELAGIAVPATNEGVSFRPVLMGQAQQMRDVLYGVYSGGTKPGMRCIKQGQWKLIKYDVLQGQVQQTQLFDLASNPHEWLEEHHDAATAALLGIAPTADQRNLAADPRYAAKRQELEQLLLAEMQRLDDPYRLWDQTQKPR